MSTFVRSRAQRGVAALEFALVAPMLFALLAGIVYFSLAVYAKLLVSHYASTSVRACVLRQEGGQGAQAMRDCAEKAFTAAASTAGFSVLCREGAGLTPKATSYLAGTGLLGNQSGGPGQASTRVEILTLRVECTATGSSLQNVLPGSGNAASPMVMQGIASMPYVLAQ